MNYRNRISDNVPALEEVFQMLLENSVPIVPQTGLPSNKHTFNRLFFDNSIDNGNLEAYIKGSIFNDEYISGYISSGANDNEPMFYIIYPDKNFPTGSKHSALLSNLANKNFSGKEQPPAIRKILHNIDYLKLVKHVSNMINLYNQNNPQNIIDDTLSAYIKNVRSLCPDIDKTCSSLECTANADFLACFLLYALFDTTNFNIYIEKIKNLSKPEIIHEENPKDEYKSSLTNRLRETALYERLLRNIFFILYLLQTICFSLLFAFKQMNYLDDRSFLAFFIIMLGCSCILVNLRFIPDAFSKKLANLQLALEYPNAYHDISSPENYGKYFNNSSASFSSIWKKRRTAVALTVTSFVVLFFYSIYINSFPVLVAGFTIAVSVLLWCDNVVHDVRQIKWYDETFGNAESGKSSFYSGFTELYEWDYDSAHKAFTHKSIYDDRQYSVRCMKHIFNQIVDYKKNTWRVFTAIIISFNLVCLIAGVFEIYFPEKNYFKIPDSSFFIVFCVVLSMITGIMNIIILLYSRKHYHDVCYFEFISSINKFNETELTKIFYHQYIYGYINDLIISRGIYNYCFEKFDENIPVTDISVSNRMLFQHKICQKKALYLHMTIYTSIAVFCILVWHMHNLSNMLWVIAFFVYGIIFGQFIFPELLRHSALHIIEKYQHSADEN
jgi:hypothetical protein